MARNAGLALGDVREVFRIIQEAIELGNDPVAWRLRMLERVCKLIDAAYGVSFVVPAEFDPKNLKPAIFVTSAMP